MATSTDKHPPIGALVSVLLALAIGSAPVAALIALSERVQ